MYTDEEFEKLEQEEREIIDESLAAILLILANTKGNIEKELREFYSKYGQDGVVTYNEARKWVSEQDHRRRLTALLAFLTLELDLAMLSIKKEFEKMLKLVIGKETGFFDVEIDMDAILEMVWGADELNWLKRLENDVDLWKVNISTDWKRSLLQRKQFKDVLKLLNKRFTSIDSIVQTLGLTESTAIGSLARRKIFAELGITKYRFYTKPDERRCETCGSMHGLVFPISAYEVGVTASPMHPRCRCWEVPIVD
jgi:SPP1 gp7 family putative phage head morphogenesis protein